MNASKQQIKAINAMLAKKGLMEDKKSLISSYTNGRTDRVSELDRQDATELLQLLNKDFVPNVEDLRAEKMRRKCIAIGWSVGLIVKRTYSTPKGVQTGPDYRKFEGWLLKYGYGKKPLNQYDYNELPKLISQLESVENNMVEKF